MKRSSPHIALMLFALLLLGANFAFRPAAVQAMQSASSPSDVNNVTTFDSAAVLPHGPESGRQVLPQNDGWASADGGTTGGASATPDHVYTVTNREQLVQALGGDNTGADATSKIIYIKGVINGNEDDTGKPLTCDDYATDGYTLDAYLAAYDPTVWGRTQVPSGPLEDARKASQKAQAARVEIFIPSNTTIIGVDSGASVVGANFMISNVNNVIVRNVQFKDSIDCFPQWDPTDGSTGNWNSAYDNVSILNNSTHVWIDHNSFTDGDLLDSQEPQYFGRIFEQHDGELDITKGADLVTTSWNRFADHDKTMLIGSTDSPTFDVGKLRVTVHHNDFENTQQRLPRVRYGEVHVYNNYYNQSANTSFQYALGVGVSSQIFAQNNYYWLSPSFSVGKVIGYFKGTAIHTEGDIVNGEPTDLLAAYNAINTPTLSGTVNWTPQYHLHIDSTQLVPYIVQRFAGDSSAITMLHDGKTANPKSVLG